MSQWLVWQKTALVDAEKWKWLLQICAGSNWFDVPMYIFYFSQFLHQTTKISFYYLYISSNRYSTAWSIVADVSSVRRIEHGPHSCLTKLPHEFYCESQVQRAQLWSMWPISILSVDQMGSCSPIRKFDNVHVNMSQFVSFRFFAGFPSVNHTL